MEQHAVRRAAGRPDHAADARVGRRLRQGRHAGGARLLPDGRHHLVGRLQPDLHRGRGREFRLRGRRRLGQPPQPVRRALPGRQAEAHRGRREPRAGCTGAISRQGQEMAVVATWPAAPGFEEKAFFEYHLYTLGRPATIPEQFDEADRALRLRDARPGEEAARLLRRGFRRQLRPTDDGTRIRTPDRTRRSTSG